MNAIDHTVTVDQSAEESGILAFMWMLLYISKNCSWTIRSGPQETKTRHCPHPLNTLRNPMYMPQKVRAVWEAYWTQTLY